MSQYGFPDLESPVSGAELINTHLEPTFEALYSQHGGASRPSYAVAGTIWRDTTTTPWLLKMFNGTANDIILGDIDPATFTFKPRGTSQWGGSAGGTANALTLTPTIPLDAYAAGVAYECLITATNTSETVTVNISGKGARTVKCSVGAGKVNPPIGVLQNGMIARFVDDGTNLILLNVRQYNKSADIATASTVNLNNASGDYVTLTGTTTVNVITLAEGVEKTCRAAGAFIITDSSGSSPQGIILPGAVNITTVAGDVFVVRGEANGTVRVVSYQRASGAALVASQSGVVLLATATASNSASISFTSFVDNTKYEHYFVEFDGVYTATDGTSLNVLLSKNNGSSYLSSYRTAASNSVSAFAIMASIAGGAAVTTAAGVFDLFGQSNGSAYAQCMWRTQGVSTAAGGADVTSYEGGFPLTSGACNAIRFQAGTGNITAGNFRLYGVAKA